MKYVSKIVIIEQFKFSTGEIAFFNWRTNFPKEWPDCTVCIWKIRYKGQKPTINENY